MFRAGRFHRGQVEVFGGGRADYLAGNRAAAKVRSLEAVP
jgi:hypothetical protein